MLARDLMTKEVVTVEPDTPVREIARLLVEHGVSAVPVVDASGMAVGMVSEGDLIGRDETDREARRDWWLTLLAEGEALHPDFLNSLRRTGRTAADVMAAPVVRVTEATDAVEIARLLETHRIKRVPVVRDGHVVGIVSRADLLRALTEQASTPAGESGHAAVHGMFADAIAAIERGFGRLAEAPSAPRPAAQATAEGGLSGADFRGLVAGHEHRMAERRAEAGRREAQRRRERIRQLIDIHATDELWRATLHRAREAAERGEKEFLLLRFPSGLCTDGGRAINAPLPDWPKTLRGEAAEIYLRWERELKSRGFHLAARVLDFPGGKPGDIGLFLVWGE